VGFTLELMCIFIDAVVYTAFGIFPLPTDFPLEFPLVSVERDGASGFVGFNVA